MAEPKRDKDAVVIGSGISGLATAYRLDRCGLDVEIMERSDHIGGAIHTEKYDDFLIDYGPNSTLETTRKIRDFVEELGLGSDRTAAQPAANRRYILRDGTLQPLPMSPPQFFLSKLFSTKAKLRLLREPFIAPAPSHKEETISEFVERRLGREFLDYAINPFVAGVYAGDPSRLSVRSAVAKIYVLEEKYGSLIKGAIKGAKERKKRAEVDKTKAELFSFKGGMGQLSAALRSRLPDRIRTNVNVERIEFLEDAYAVYYKSRHSRDRLYTKSVIFTTPAYVTSAYLKPVAPQLSKQLNEIEYPPVAVVFFGFMSNVPCRPLDGFGFLVPEIEKRRILGTIWSSTVFPNRAPESGMALTTFVGGMRQPELAERDDEALSRMVFDELKQIMSLGQAPDLVKVKRWPRAIPQYQLGHQNRLDSVAQFESEHPGIFISGNFRGGISVGDCIVQSEVVAQKVRTFCERSQEQVQTSAP